MKDKRVLIAGIGGASLGTELLKCLVSAGGYTVFGCDISPLAYGHFMSGFKRTYTVERTDYVDSVMDICRKEHVAFLVPGGEEPLQILNKERTFLSRHGIYLVANSTEVVETFTAKNRSFEILRSKGFEIPRTIEPKTEADFDEMEYPCIAKPCRDSGGSDGVVIVSSRQEALQRWRMYTDGGKAIILQEYLPHHEGEFSLAVLSLPNHGVVGSIALRKVFENKFSIHSRTATGVISGPYSSGLIDDFEELCAHAESIAEAVGSTGPMNIQGRVRNGLLLPFEINPRFSGSEYIRTMAGFNQLDIFLTYVRTGQISDEISRRPGYYLRSLTEMYVPTVAPTQ